MKTNEKEAGRLMRERDVDSLRRLYRNGGMTRREFVSALVNLGIGISVAGTIVAGTPVVEAATPRHGGHVRAAGGTQGPDDTLDPAKFKSSIDYCRGEQFYNGLTRINGKLEAEGELAESWEPDPSAQEWTFRLRKGVEFHNGKSLEAADVIYSIRRILDGSVASGARVLVKQIKEIKADDKNTVRFKLADPNADFPIVLGLHNLKILPDGWTDFSTAMGTGPFTVKEFKPGVRSVGVRFTNYWDDDKPYLDEIEWFAISDPVARINALLAGDVQLLGGVDAEAAPMVERAPGVRLVTTPSGQFVEMVMMCDRPPGENDDFRTAIKYLMQREDVVKRLFHGHARIGNDTPIAPSDPFYCDDIPIRPFDPDKARFHLKKAGMEGANVQVFSAPGAGRGATELALMVRQAASKIGLNVEVKQVPSDGYWSTTWMHQPIFMAGWNPRPTADIMLTLAFKSDSPWNETHWHNDHFDELLKRGRGELDHSKRKQIYCEAQRLIHDTGGCALPAFFDYVDGMSDKVKGFEKIPLGPLAAGQWPKQIWLEG
ncbi:MAG: ABC transporter substrate-binding protein [Arenicellales bacterium]